MKNRYKTWLGRRGNNLPGILTILKVMIKINDI